jgi:predicted phage terminase large subunit-like protein
MADLTEEQVKIALRNKEAALIEIDKIDCYESFYTFVQRCWHVLEPSKPFTQGWAVKSICDALQAVTEGKIKRLIVNVPPGCTKSMTTSVLWAAWEWGPRGLGSNRFINASYEKTLSTRDLVRARDLLLDDWFQARWPMAMKADVAGKQYYENEHSGFRLATSVGGALTGFRGDRIVVDDPHDVRRAESDVMREEALRWWTETVPTRLNDMDNSAIVLIMQRLHSSDLSGHSLKHIHDEDWVHLCLPMRYESDRGCEITVPGFHFKDPRTEDGQLLWPERFSENAVTRMEATLSSRGGSYAVSGQLQQRPVSREGGLFKLSNVQLTRDPPPARVVCRVRGWDLAATNKKGADYTVGLKMSVDHSGRIFIEDICRLRGSPHEVQSAIKRAALMDGLDTVIYLPQDPGQAGKAQKSALATLLQGFNVRFSPESGDKVTRTIPFAAQWEAGNVVLRDAPWSQEFIGEVSQFPLGDHDDQVDACSRAYSWIVAQTTTGPQIGSWAGMIMDLNELRSEE